MTRHPEGDEFLKQLGLNLKRVRQEKGISQYKLGLETETDASYIRKIERGKQNLTILSLLNIAKVLDINIIEVLP